MKKLFFTFILVFCLAAGFAETGYRGAEWFINQNKLDFNGVATEWKINEELNSFCISEIELDERVIKIFYFEDEQLIGLSYFIPKKSLKDLLSKFDKRDKVYEIKADVPEISVLARTEAKRKIKDGDNPQIIQNIEDKEKKAYMYSIFIAEKNTLEFAKKYEKEGYKNIRKSTDSQAANIYIYKVNEDTRMYIIQKKSEDYIYVAYVPHFKDY